MGTSFALAALLVHTKKAMIWLARQIAVLTIVMAVLGIWRHFDENYNTASLDSRYTERWETMSTETRLWSVTVGYKRLRWSRANTRLWGAGADRRGVGYGDHWPGRTLRRIAKTV